jgi:hypothetical protein
MKKIGRKGKTVTGKIDLMMLKRILEENGALGWLNLGRLLNLNVTVVELPACVA